ncbi:MAG: bifunctional phosphopantothenoylcysteine decarboxylase/phosphopantothenate--cysteine ligase CoaBC [Nitrospirota bacterium]
MLQGKKVVLGVTGSIAAYKSAELIRALRSGGADVTVVMTENAERFISPLTFETLSLNHVYREKDLWERPLSHITLQNDTDLILIAPATANIIGKMATGIADDILSTLLIATRKPVIIAPSMNEMMYENPIFQRNKRILEEQGVYFIEPEEGALACGYEGKGRLASVEIIVKAVEKVFDRSDALKGEKVLVTAGPTMEDIDPIRIITNRSSGRMGFELAASSIRRGADVILISGDTNLIPPYGAEHIKVRTTAEMRDAVLRYFKDASIVIMAAAVSDYRPEEPMKKKMKKEEDIISLRLVRNPDILMELGMMKGKRLLVGFAVETESPIENGMKKLKDKNLDLIVVNDANAAGSDMNSVIMIDKGGSLQETPLMPKREIAEAILEKIVEIKHT